MIPPEDPPVAEAHKKHLTFQSPARPEQRAINDSGREAAKRFTMVEH